MSRTALRDNAFQVLRAAAASPTRDAFEAHLAAYDDAMWRDGPPEHFTASAVVFSADHTEVLLVLHKKAKLWLQPGGHFEDGDSTVAGAALREATEESGIEGLSPVPGALYLHRHDLAAAFGRCMAHWDLRIAAVAPPEAAVTVSDESDDVRWWPVDALPEPTDPDLAECIDFLRGQLVSA
ncbi:NUDIX hydrolase [Flexivirga sp. B27]